MTQTRRDFLRAMSAVAATGVAKDSIVGNSGWTQGEPANLVDAGLAAPSHSVGDPFFRELTAVALDAARSAGASYADIRIAATKTQSVESREQRVEQVNDRETFGFGVRTLVNGAWGFAASNTLTRDNVAKIAKMAAQEAQANSKVQREKVS